jgi:hypothetical protein
MGARTATDEGRNQTSLMNTKSIHIISNILTPRHKETRALMMLLLLSDLEQLGHTAVEEFGKGVAQLESDAEESIEQHAQRLEAKLEQLYAVAATLAQREDKLDGVEAIWARMVAICDQMAKAVSGLRPGAGLRLSSYDRILDIRNACEDNRALHA